MRRATAIAIVCAAIVGAAPSAFAQAGGGRSRPQWYDAPAADVPSIAIRPFLDVEREAFRASHTFDAVFGESSKSLWGGGVQVVLWQGRVYGEVGASRLLTSGGELVGERVFLSGTTVSRLGIPLRVKIQPIEIIGGYRFNVTRELVPFVGGGFARYHYTEASDFADPSENLDVSHGGAVFEAGAEWRFTRWVRASGSAHYTHVPGILGSGGISQQFVTSTSGAFPGESDLGGWSARLRVLVGR